MFHDHHGTFEKRDSEHKCFSANLFSPEIEKTVFQYASGSRSEYARHDEHGRTALFCAAESGNLILLRALLDQGLDPMKKDDSGEIPLSAAV